MNPYMDARVRRYVGEFLQRFFDDNEPRVLVFGINPGRFGAGITGITFTDPVALADFCGITNALPRRRELSSIFVYDVIERLGGVRTFYRRFFLTATSPLGFTRKGRNLNYYDDPRLARAVTPFITQSIERQIALGGRRDRAIVLGKGANMKFVSRLNAEHGFFQEIHALEHPRPIMQYRRRNLDHYLSEYVKGFRQIAAVTALACAAPVLAQESFAFTHVTVIDGEDSKKRVDQTVVVRGNRIVSVTPSRGTGVPSDARIVDGRGKFLIPGLWDMHVHTAVIGGPEVLPMYVANGVTGVRDMAGEWATLTAYRTDIERGRLVGPRIVASGPYLEGGNIPIPHLLSRTPDEARAAVDSLVRLGADFVKVHGQLTRDTYFAIARRARERGIAFAGHVPRVVGSAAASDSGQRSIEHLLAIPAPCTPAESLALRPRFPVQSAIGRCSSEDLAPLYARFVRNSTWVTPTFVAQYEIASWPRRAVPGDSLARYLPDSLRDYVAKILPMPDSIPSDAHFVGLAMFAKRLAQVAAMHRAGVRILAGTDAPLRNSPPGFGLHEELLLLVRGGLSAEEALRAATAEPARYFGMLDSLGTIEPGKLADLVLLEANPLDDIRNTRRIAAVVANGRLYDAKDRERLLRRN